MQLNVVLQTLIVSVKGKLTTISVQRGDDNVLMQGNIGDKYNPLMVTSKWIRFLQIVFISTYLLSPLIYPLSRKRQTVNFGLV